MTLAWSRHAGPEWTRFRDDSGYVYDYNEARYPPFDTTELPVYSERGRKRPESGYQQIVYISACDFPRLFRASARLSRMDFV